MQFTGNPQGVSSNKKIAIGAVIAIIAVAALVLIFQGTQKSKEGTPGESDLYYDTHSGEFVSDPDGWQDENFATESGTPIFLGFTKLLDIGLTQFQLDAVKDGFTQYSQAQGNSLREVSLHINTVTRDPFDPTANNKQRVVRFTVTLNRTDERQAVVSYESIRSASLKLYENSKLLFTSVPNSTPDEQEDDPNETLEPGEEHNH